MEAEGARDDIPISDPEVGRMLEILALGSRARRIVEVGTAIGYGTLCLARGAPGAEVISIDTDHERLERARAYLEKGGVADRVRLLEGPALNVIPTLEDPIDLAYVDAIKTDYRRYLDLLLPKMSVGGTLLFDNLLWGGHVAAPPEDYGERLESGEVDDDLENADAMRAFNGYLMMHPQLRAVVLPIADGLGLATKTKPTIMEMGGPY